MTDGMKRLFQDLKNKTVSYKEFLRQFLTYCCENDRLFLALYKTDSFLIKKDFTELIGQYDPLEESVPKDERTYIFEFYISGVFSVIAGWLCDDREKSIDDMAALLYRLTRTKLRRR